MKNEPFVLERVYQAPSEKVWEAITDRDQMKRWYFDLPEFRPEVGFTFEFEGGSETKTYLHLCQVTEVVPGQKLAYSWRYHGYAGNSLVTWELFAEGPDRTRLRLTHAGLETFPQHIADFARESFVAGWTDLVGDLLRKYVEQTLIRESIAIAAPADRVWAVLRQPELGKEWVGEFSAGAYFESDWEAGSEVFWKDQAGEVGTKGIVTESQPASLLQVRYFDEVTASDPAALGDYTETFSLSSRNGTTTLAIESGPLPPDQAEHFLPLWGKALAKIKELAER